MGIFNVNNIQKQYMANQKKKKKKQKKRKKKKKLRA